MNGSTKLRRSSLELLPVVFEEQAGRKKAAARRAAEDVASDLSAWGNRCMDRVR